MEDKLIIEYIGNYADALLKEDYQKVYWLANNLKVISSYASSIVLL